MDVRLLINYRGKWDGLQYIGGETYVELVSKELTYLELEDLVFEDINVEKTLYDLRISSMVSAENGRRKYHIRRDRDVRFLLHTGGTHCSEIYVDLVDKVRRDVREDHPLPQGTSRIPTRVLFEPSHPSPYVASTGNNQASESVPTTQNVAPTVEVPIWNGDYGIPDSFIGEQQETTDVNDSDSTDDDSSSEDDSDEEGQGSGQNQGQIGAHVQYNPYNVVPPHWVIPGADQYSINSPSSEASTSNVGAFYKESRRQSGRPKEIRASSAGEVTQTQHCTKCGESGHNRLGCSNPRRIPTTGQSSTSVSQDQPVIQDQPVRKQRACSVCHVLGHNRKTCPLVDRTQSTACPSSDANTSQ
ncbi:hypothetical protein EZV62_015722 [Acer yangbiense]|uniref:CCHC-type domain-containing protein n=1 Tax=Acer yangbiense TaxID=1000413 RepID=A0A5C7HLM9_9ROSI|nr:hypothetical protein EZV62_015722 [Acer yangbiense]